MSNIVNRPPNKTSGMYVGPPHSEGGIAAVIDGVKPVEIEGDEYHICAAAMKSTEVFEFTNKTNKQILDKLFREEGCVFEQGKANGGDFIVCKLVVLDETPRSIKGTPKQILNTLQKEKACKMTSDANKAPASSSAPGDAKKQKGGKILTPEEIETLHHRWSKKRGRIENLANNIRSLRLNVTRDLKSDDEKTALTALVIAVMDRTAERVGNEKSAAAGHYGVTGLKKKHVKVIGNKILLDYVGKSGVAHEKSFSDSRLAKPLKKALKNAKGNFVFTTHDGFRVKADKVNRYLADFDVSAKDIRGYSSNRWIIEKLQKQEIPGDEKVRKKLFLKVLRNVAEKVGHGPATLRKHYVVPEVMSEYVIEGKIADLKDRTTFEKGGDMPGKLYPVSDTAYQLEPKNSVLFWVTPDEFLSIAAPLNIMPEDEEIIQDLKKRLEAGEKTDALDLRILEGRVAYHDGRHRAYAAKLAGIDKVPVVVVDAEQIKHEKFDFKPQEKGSADCGCVHTMANGGELSEAETYKKWKSLVNMSKGELEKFYNSEEGKEAGLTATEAKEQGIDSGRESARWIIKMKDTPVSEWTPTMWKWAKKQISFISRMSGNKGSLYDEKGNKTRKHTSLLIWGHNPEKKKFNEGGPTTYDLLAPNGKKSKLNSLQYKLVRTPEFKKWFGDWEALARAKEFIPQIKGIYKTIFEQDTEQALFEISQQANNSASEKTGSIKAVGKELVEIAQHLYPKTKVGEKFYPIVSKVVDENGEPLVVYHGTDKKFNEFTKTSRASLGTGFYFTQLDVVANNYGKYLIRIFLNLKNPISIIEDNDIDLWHKKFQTSNKKRVTETLIKEGYDGVISQIEIVAFNPEQIKLADGINTTFDANNPDIRFEDGGPVDIKPQIVIHNNTNSAYDKEAQKILMAFLKNQALANKKFAEFITKSGQTINNYNAIAFLSEEYHPKRTDKYFPAKLVYVKTAEEAYQQALNADSQTSNFIRIWRADNKINFAVAVEVDLFGDYTSEMYNNKGYLKQEVKDGAIAQLKKSLLIDAENKMAQGGNFELPTNHQPFIKVPKGGSCCANCKFLTFDKKSCGNKYFIQWYGKAELPQPIDEYCSDWYEPAEKLAQGGDLENINKNTKFVHKITQDEIRNVISGKSQVSNGEAINAAANYLRNSPLPSAQNKGTKFYQKQEGARLKEYATRHNLWFPYNFVYKKEFSSGAEQKVYLLNEKSVVKLNQGRFYDYCWLDYFTSLLLHNYFFPDTAYKLIGFSENEGELYAVVQQRFVEETEKTDLSAVARFMSDNGFEKIAYETRPNSDDYYNKELELKIEDLHDENVLTKDGILYFIDTVFYFEHKKHAKFEEGGYLHGSKFNFCNSGFSLSKAGSGQGQSIWGKGLYFTKDKDLAEFYARFIPSNEERKKLEQQVADALGYKTYEEIPDKVETTKYEQKYGQYLKYDLYNQFFKKYVDAQKDRGIVYKVTLFKGKDKPEYKIISFSGKDYLKRAGSDKANLKILQKAVKKHLAPYKEINKKYLADFGLTWDEKKWNDAVKDFDEQAEDYLQNFDASQKRGYPVMVNMAYDFKKLFDPTRYYKNHNEWRALSEEKQNELYDKRHKVSEQSIASFLQDAGFDAVLYSFEPSIIPLKDDGEHYSEAIVVFDPKEVTIEECQVAGTKAPAGKPADKEADLPSRIELIEEMLKENPKDKTLQARLELVKEMIDAQN